MQYRLLTLDIDGTLRPSGERVVPQQNVEAVRAVQRAGVKVAIATGRCRMGIPDKMLGRGPSRLLDLCGGGPGAGRCRHGAEHPHHDKRADVRSGGFFRGAARRFTG